MLEELKQPKCLSKRKKKKKQPKWSSLSSIVDNAVANLVRAIRRQRGRDQVSVVQCDPEQRGSNESVVSDAKKVDPDVAAAALEHRLIFDARREEEEPLVIVGHRSGGVGDSRLVQVQHVVVLRRRGRPVR